MNLYIFSFGQNEFIYYIMFINDIKTHISILLCKCICNYILHKYDLDEPMFSSPKLKHNT